MLSSLKIFLSHRGMLSFCGHFSGQIRQTIFVETRQWIFTLSRKIKSFRQSENIIMLSG